jgi:hypothetical protein
MDSLGTNELIPLPELPLWREMRPDRIGLRPFGRAADDLEVDFSWADRAALATHLLDICTADVGDLPDGFYKDITIGKRIEMLLVLAFGRENAGVPLLINCPNCAEELEIELALAEISDLQSTSDGSETIQVRLGDDRPFFFRKPTGRDQEIWANTVYRDEDAALRAMIDSLAVEPELVENLEPDAFIEIEDALDEADPLVNFSCLVTCEVCGLQHEHEVDLLEIALGKLKSAQNELLLTVHRLAVAYHWSEKEIFEIPNSRRVRYLHLVREGIK